MMTNQIAMFLNVMMKPIQRWNLRFRSLSPRNVLVWLLTLTLVCQMAAAPVAAAVRFDSANDSSEKKADKNKPAKPSANKQQINSVPVTSVSAASFEDMAAPDSIIAAFGSSLATATRAATTIPLPTTIEGTTVAVRDSVGVERLAPLFFVSPAQVNYAVPAETALGQATVEVRSGDGTISRGMLTIRAVAPAIFTANSNGRGVPAANLLRVKADGAQIFEPLAEFDAAEGRFKTKPIDLGPEGERVFLILYLTGLRRAADPNNDGNLNESFRLLIGGVEASVRNANPAQLEVVVPFGAETGRVSVRTPGGEGESANALSIRTSISGFVEDTQRQPLAGATVRLVGATIMATTNADGAFILPDAPAGARVIEVEAGATQSRVSYPKLRLRVNVAANRDNQFTRPIALQPVAGAGLPVSSAGFDKDESINAPISDAASAGSVPLPYPGSDAGQSDARQLHRGGFRHSLRRRAAHRDARRRDHANRNLFRLRRASHDDGDRARGRKRRRDPGAPRAGDRARTGSRHRRQRRLHPAQRRGQSRRPDRGRSRRAATRQSR